MSNFSSEICPDWAEKIYWRPCLESLLPEAPISLDLLHYIYNLSWIIEIFRVLVILLIVFRNKSSDGFSCKSLVLYILAGICRFSNIMEVNDRIFFIPKYTYLVFSFLLLIVTYTFRRPKDEKDDNQSLLLLLFGSIALTLMRNDERLVMSLVTLSMILETAALIPQFSLSYKQDLASVTVYFSISVWFFGKAFLVMYYIMIASLSRQRVDRGFGDFCNRVMIGVHVIMLSFVILINYFAAVYKKFSEAYEKSKKSNDRSFLREMHAIMLRNSG